MTAQRKITIGGKKYTLTANRYLLKTLNKVAPDFLSLSDIKDEKERNNMMHKVSMDIYTGLDEIFYEMIKVANPSIDKEKSDEILEKFEKEYGDVANELITFAYSVFPQGDQKKKIIWE